MGKRLAEHSRKKKEEQRKEQAKLEKTASGVNQYCGIRAVIALGVIGGLGYYIYRTKKGQVRREVKDVSMPHNPPKHPLRLTSLRWIKSILYYKNGQEEYSK